MSNADALAARLPIFGRVRLYLQQRAAAGDKRAEELLSEVEAYEDAIAEGVILVGGVWIV